MIRRTYIRQYPYHSLAAQLLGYVGEISSSQISSDAKLGYVAGDEIGQAGVEATYDTYLRGVVGAQQLHGDPHRPPQGPGVPALVAKPRHRLRLPPDIHLHPPAQEEAPAR